METKEQKEIHDIEFKILKAFKKYCKKHNLTFFLIGGTLLGAIRHKGFIPWDDDIDIGMLRSDYNKLISFAEKDLYIDDEKRYKILLPLRENYIYPQIKIIDTNTIAYEKKIKRKYATGLWVDVFPYDYGANTRQEAKKLSNKNHFYKKFFQVGISGELSLKEKILKAIAFPVYKLITQGDYKYWIKKMLKVPSASPTRLVGDVIWIYDERDMYPKEWFDDLIDVEFEGEKFKAPSHYDEYLTQFYGEYMKLPKEEDRVFHGFEWHYVNKK